MKTDDPTPVPGETPRPQEVSYQDILNSRNTLRALFDSLPIAIYIVDTHYNLVAINTSRAARVGEKPSSLVGRRCYEKMYRRTTPCEGCLVANTLSNGGNTRRNTTEKTGVNQAVEWEISTYPIYDANCKPVQAIIVEQDISEKRMLEANLVQSEKLAAVGHLAASVAHEINNPLTAIIANAQILRRELTGLDADLLDSVNLIELAGTRASQVVRNLLGIARKERYEFLPTDLNETLQNALSLVQHALVGRPIRVHLHLDNNLPTLTASKDQLQGVWINLLLNAIDAIDKPQGEISITTRHALGRSIVQIEDNGKGIAQENLVRVFEPFFTTKTAERGTGLGLSFCQRVVNHHGGDIEVESLEGGWSRFTVSLPGK